MHAFNLKFISLELNTADRKIWLEVFHFFFSLSRHLPPFGKHIYVDSLSKVRQNKAT